MRSISVTVYVVVRGDEVLAVVDQVAADGTPRHDDGKAYSEYLAGYYGGEARKAARSIPAPDGETLAPYQVRQSDQRASRAFRESMIGGAFAVYGD
jgi:hypothetical protein